MRERRFMRVIISECMISNGYDDMLIIYIDVLRPIYSNKLTITMVFWITFHCP